MSLSTLVWRPYYWIVYRHEPDLRPFLIRRWIWGGGKLTPERRQRIKANGVEW
jgi:hypothetical protein